MLTPAVRHVGAGPNCGARGWVSDARGYRYSATDPATASPGQIMPAPLRQLVEAAAAEGGLCSLRPRRLPDQPLWPGRPRMACTGQDERDFSLPIVSVSLGLPPCFCGAARAVPTTRCACRWRTATWWSSAVTAALPRRGAGGGRRAPAHQGGAHQPDVPAGGLSATATKNVVS